MSGVPPAAQSRKILAATAIAAAVAALILVTAVLPAEYGIDPLGTGRALALTALSGTAPAENTHPAATPSAPAGSGTTPGFAQDIYKVELRPFEGVEYKYRLEQNASLVYDSYSKATAATAQGAFTAAKAGIHGWYWKNHGEGRVTVTLRSAGFYSTSTEFRDGEQIERRFPIR